MSLALVENSEVTAAAEPVQPLFVLKFGSSILRSSEDLPRAAGEIYRQRRAGRAVIAIVSALAGETDRLLQQAAAVTGLASCRGVPDLVSLGEDHTAALLRLACDRIGLRAEICRAEQLGLRTEGDGLNAQPVRLESSALLAKLRATGVVIVPGFVGLDSAGERTLLGRGGSDFSAIFIGGELAADCVRLYKDVDGVFERDPAQDQGAGRFAEISWGEALRIARPLIQPTALEYAAARELVVEVEALGSANPTIVGPRSGPAEPAAVRRPLRVSIAGYGVVGQALAERLHGESSFDIRAILVRDTGRARAVPPPVAPTSSQPDFLAYPTDIIVDALSCEETGSLLCNTVLPKGVDIVSASKRLISSEHGRLSDAALQGGSQLLYSAAVGGSATVLETVDRARADGEIREVVGVLNGTVNFILQRLSQGVSFAEALREAQARGFAEEDPEADLSGADAAAKLRLIAHGATGIPPQALAVTTQRLDRAMAGRIQASEERWVQVARAVNDAHGIEASVTLQPLREVPELPTILDEWNCAAVTLQDGRIYRCVGRGAGGAATAEAIVADLYQILRGRIANEHRGQRRMLTSRSDCADIEVLLPRALQRFGRATTARLTGNPRGPLIAALGGISGNRLVCRGDGGEPGWWPGLVGEDCVVNPQRHRVLGIDFAADPTGRCAPSTEDQARVLAAALDSIGRGCFDAIVGASYGGMVALSFAEHFPARVSKLAIISAAAEPHPAATAIRELQRRVVALGLSHGDGDEALSIARGIAMLTYRTPEEFSERFCGGVPDEGSLSCSAPGFYLRARGRAFRTVMSPERFLSLSASIDRHRVDPFKIEAETLLVGANSDQLVPPCQMRALAEALGTKARLHLRDSLYGHDMFLKEAEEVGRLLNDFLEL